MSTALLTNLTVKSAIEALNAGKSNEWFDVFTSDATLYDDGNKMDFHSFFKKAIGHEWFVRIDKVENNGLDVFGSFYSDQWGDFKTTLSFTSMSMEKSIN